MLARAILIFILRARLTEGSDLPMKCATGVIMGRLGSSVVLPCWLSSRVDVEAMEIRWYRPNQYNTPVLLYLNRLIVTDQQDERYRNRTSLSLRDECSTGLKEGDVSLRLENLTIADWGTFHCFVSGDKAYGNAMLTLNLAALGSSPLLSLQPQDDLVNVTCRSCGWLPKPQLEWKSNGQISLHPGGLLFSQETELTCVHSWVFLSPSHSKWISCSISLSGGEEKVGNVDIRSIVPLEQGAGPWKVLFGVSVLTAVAMIAVSVFLYKKRKTGYMAAKEDEETVETGNLHIYCANANMEDLRKEAVSITLDDTRKWPDLIVKSNMVRDCTNAASNHKGPGFPYHLSIIGNVSFTCGRAYWEVDLILHNTQVKTSWLIGVTSASDLTTIKSEPTPTGGFWFIYSDRQTGLQVNTEPEIILPIVPSLERVGVLLDYGHGELSFYNAKEGKHLITIKAQFQGKVVPLFNPGIGDEAPLLIRDITRTSPKCNSPSVPAEGASSLNDNSKEPQ